MDALEPSEAPTDEQIVPRGTVIFRQGDPGDSMFVIARGRVRIALSCEGQETSVAVLEAGDFFGELSLLSGEARTATAQAIEDTRLVVVGRNVFAMMMQDDLEIVFRMLRAMGERLGRTDRQFWDLMHRHGRVRLLAEGLRRAGVARSATPVVLDLEGLAADLRLDAPSVRVVIDDLVRRGAGALDDGRWRIETPAHVHAITELLSAYAEGRTSSPAATESRGGPSSG